LVDAAPPREIGEVRSQTLEGSPHTTSERASPAAAKRPASGESRSVEPAAGIPSIRSAADRPNNQIAELSETSFVIPGSTFSLDLTGNEREHESGSRTGSLEKHFAEKGGVVRVGEQVSAGERKPDAEVRPNLEVGRESGLQSSIRSDYLEGIREWLETPSITSEAGLTGRDVDQPPEQVSTPLDPADQSQWVPRAPRAAQDLHTVFVEREPDPQNEIQEFSLSIGSISIVVEEPAQQPKLRSNSVQPVESALVNAQPRARDAFALSRSYFRGF